jgi:bacteriorhodopsin
MIHRPKTVIGYVFLFLIALGISPILVSLAGSLSSPWLWAPVAVIALTCIAVLARRRRLEATRERAWIGSFSFADAVASMRARESQQAAH